MTEATPLQRAEGFFNYAKERERIRLKKEAGDPKPWSQDRVFQETRFTNVFREDDKTTKWFRENARDQNADDAVMAMGSVLLFRWYNLISTGEHLFKEYHDERSTFETWIADVLDDVNYDEEKCVQTIVDAVEELPRPWFTSAYIIKVDNTEPKHVTVARAATKILRAFVEQNEPKFVSLEELWRWLKPFHGMGPFIAYEAVTDLRWTVIGREAIDVNTWANAGPGAARGLSWVYYGTAAYSLNFEGASNQDFAIKAMRWLLDLSRWETFWPWPDRKWSMREVEHTLCEYDKYQRVYYGAGRSKRAYPGAS